MADSKPNPQSTQKPGMLNQGQPGKPREEQREEQSEDRTTLVEIVKQQGLMLETALAQLRALNSQTQTNTANVSVLDRRADLMEERIVDRDIFSLWGHFRVEIKNQLESDRLFQPRQIDGNIVDKRYRVGLLGEVKGGDQSPIPLLGRNKEHKEPNRTPTGIPEVDLWANSPEEAKGRYMQLCGINGVYHTVSWNIREIPPQVPEIPSIATEQEQAQILKMRELLVERTTRTGKARPPWDMTPNRQYAALMATVQG